MMKKKVADIENAKGVPAFRNKNGRDMRGDKNMLVRSGFNSDRKVRADCKVGNFEKQIGQSGVIRNPENGRKIRKDAKIGAVRKKFGE